MYERALAINEKALGKDHPETALIRKNMAFNLLRPKLLLLFRLLGMLIVLALSYIAPAILGFWV